MNADEIVRALRICNRPKGHRCSECPIFSRYEHRTCKATVDKAAADLIESLQAQLAEYDALAKEYGIDGKTMLALAKSQISTAKANVELQEQLAALRTQPEITGETSDGYHTFNELYHHRAVLFSVICNSRPELAWKSKLHHDGTMYDGMFIVGIETPDGQATYHYNIEPYWEMFSVQELPQAPEWDGHTPAQAIERIGKLIAQPENEPLTLEELRQLDGEPVWTVTNGIEGSGRWEILESVDNEFMRLCNPVDTTYDCPIDTYGKTWLAYRRKPEGSEKE